MRHPHSVALALVLLAGLSACGKTGAPTARIAVPTGAHAVGELVVVDASGSADAQGKALQYHWSVASRPAGSRARLSGDTLSRAVLQPDAEGTYGFELVVSNGVLTDATKAEVEVKCGIAAPQVAIDPAPTSNRVGSPLALSATVTDADDGAACGGKQTWTIAWRFRALPAGSRSTILGAEGVKPSFIPDVPGTYTLEAKATDSTGRQGTASVDVTVATCGASAPEITELGSTPATVGSPVKLSATANDPDAQEACGGAGELSYAWRLVGIPAGSHAGLVGPAMQTPWFTPDLAGKYDVELTVTDATGLSAARRLAIDASECGGNAPVISGIVPSNAAPATGEAVALVATATDADNADACGAKQTVRLAWRTVSLPAGSAARLSDDGATAPWVTPDVPGTYVFGAIATDSTGRSSVPAQVTFTASTCGDNVPVADVGPALDANIGEVVQIHGSASDADTGTACGLTETFRWTWSFAVLPAGSHATLTGRQTSTPWFVPDVDGAYVLEGVVSDRAGHLSAPARVTVTTSTCGGRAPVVATDFSPANPGALVPVRLSALADDPDNATGCSLGQGATFAWSFDALPAGSHATIANPTAQAPWFTPDLAGTYVARVTVTDSTGRAGTAVATVEASGCGLAAPTVSATLVTAAPSVGLPVVLSATGHDADADAPCSQTEPLAYEWAFDALPAGSGASLNDPSLAAPSFVPDLPGNYALRVTVRDAAGHSGSALVPVVVTSCGSAAPVALASATPLAPSLGQAVALAASATDADNDASCGRAETFAWAWSFVSLPAGSRAHLSAPTGTAPSFVPDVAGTYAVQLVATDSAGHPSAPSVVTVTATSCGGATPSATIAVSPAAPNAGDRVSLAATASDADNAAPCSAGQALSYAWSFESLPTGSRAAFTGAATALGSFVPDFAGTYSVRLVVSDGTGRQSVVRKDVVADACGASRPQATVANPGSLAVGVPFALVPTVTDADNGSLCQARTPPPPLQSFSYRWTLLSAPVGSGAALSSTSARAPSIVPDRAGSYLVRLVVTDSTGLSSVPLDSAFVVGSCGASTPIATVSASNGNPGIGQGVQFTLAYTDADESPACKALIGAVGPVSYGWRLLASPAGSAASIRANGTSVAALVPDLAGTYTVEGTVTDTTGRSSRMQASVSASACGGAAPSAAPQLATGQTIRVNGPISVLANASDTDNQPPCSLAQALSYRWSFTELPAGSQPSYGDRTVKDFSFTPDLAGTYVLSLVVTDSTGRRSAPAGITVTVGSCGGAAPVPQVRMTSPSNAGPSASLVVNPLLSCAFQLDARDTTDADAACGLPQTANDLDYSWEQLDAPAGSQSRLSSPNAANPWFVIDQGGTYDFRLTASDGRLTSSTPATVRIVHKGFSIASVSPAVSCFGAVPTTLTLTAGGQGFLRVNATNTLPAVSMSPGSATVQGVSGCAPSGVAGIDACTTMTVQIPAGLLVGNYTITVKNPVQDGCAAQAFYSIGPPPTISSVTPTQVCGADDPLQPDQFSANVRGSGFLQATQLSLGSALAVSTTFNSSGNMDAIFNIPAPGTYGLSASNGTACGSTLSNAVSVLAVPLVFFVDPPVVYNGINTQATAYISGLNGGSVDAVRIRPAGTQQALTNLTFTYDPARANQVKILLPAGLAAGDYEVLVTDHATCTSIPVSAIKVTGSLTLALSKIDPPFGATAQNTSVDLRAAQPPPSGQEAFLSTPPRVYLNPTGTSGLARALNTVTVVNGGLANAVVKAGIPAGTYDVIVVNPDGAVGLLPAAYRAVTNPPPTIDSITPGSIPSGTAANILVQGQNFSSPSFRWDCVDSVGNATSYTAVVSSATSTTLQASAPPGVSIGTVCVGVVTNGDNTYGEYSALGVTGPSENLGAFSGNSAMGTARRAPAVTSARPTRSARFLYALGGDSGSAATALSSAEAVPLDRYGNLGSWRPLPIPLPVALTMSQAQTIGRYVYLVGGNSGSKAVANAWRALVLDPNAAPDITDLFLQFKSGALGPGTWYYRIAAVMGGGDADNPGGEGLPSDPLTVQIPSLPNTLSATLTWSAVPGAGSYRIYRSPSANAAAGTEQLIGTTTATSFVDDGKAVSAGSPRKLGDLGTWVSLPNLGTTRQAAGLSAGRDPSNPTVWYLYAVAGLTAGGTADDGYEFLTVTVDSATGKQTVSNGWTSGGTNRVTTGRTQTALFNVTDLVTTRVLSGETWLHLGPGLSAGGASVSDVDAAKVQAGGQLTSWTGENSPNNRAGYVFAAAANQLFIFGGQGASPTTGGVSASLCGVGAGSPCAGPPGLKNWNAGISLTVPRYLPGTVVESARIFAIGGQSTSGPTNTVESVIW